MWHKNQGLLLVRDVDHHEMVKNTDVGHQLFGLRQPFRTPFSTAKNHVGLGVPQGSAIPARD